MLVKLKIHTSAIALVRNLANWLSGNMWKRRSHHIASASCSRVLFLDRQFSMSTVLNISTTPAINSIRSGMERMRKSHPRPFQATYLTSHMVIDYRSMFVIWLMLILKRLLLPLPLINVFSSAGPKDLLTPWLFIL
jgi:hypothetical protein